MKRLLPHPLLTPTLALVWLLLNNSMAPGQIILGLLLGWAIPLFALPFWPERVRIRHWGTLLRFVGVVLFDILVANLKVAWLILGQPRNLRPAFVVVPLDVSHELAISILANTICLTPGTVSAHLSEDRQSLLVHALDVDDQDELAATIKARYEAPLKEIFEC
ncbi:MAG: Na+/H+ antiporter subunit E [Pseudomonadota bacterium]